MKTLLKYILYVFIILILISSVTALIEKPFSEKPEEISLSKLASQINSKDVQSIEINGENLSILYIDGNKAVSIKESGTSLSETLRNLGADSDRLRNVQLKVIEESGMSFILTTILPLLIPFLFLLFIFWFMFRQAKQGSMQAFTFGKSKAKLANLAGDTKKKVTFEDVAGLDEAKEEVSEIVEFLKDPRRFYKLGARIPRGVLLVGSPGTGKTLLARAVANEARVPFYYVSGSEFVEMFVGVGASRVSNMFETAKKNAPAIVFIDEIDAVGRHRGAGLGGGHDEREQTLNQILVEMDGFDTHDAVIIMAATNRPDILDPALLRPGRFDRMITLDAPSLNDREKILKIHATDKPVSKDVDFKKVAQRTPGFSGADLANLVNEGAILAARKNQKEIVQENLFQAIEKVILGPERRSHAFSEKEKEITAYHEAGHALVAASLPHTDPVHKISIISRGRAGGYTLKLPLEDRHLRSRSEFKSELAVLLGGYAAEDLKFGEITTGASNDLKVASDIARKMVTKYGMSSLGPISFGEQEEQVFLGKEFGHTKNYSEKVALDIDTEISNLIEEALTSAKKILTEKMNSLIKIADELLDKETLEQDDFYALLKN